MIPGWVAIPLLQSDWQTTANEPLNGTYCRFPLILASHIPYPQGSLGHHRWFHTSFPHFSLFSTALWDFANSRPVHSLMLSSHLLFCLPSSSYSDCALQDGFGQTWWTGDVNTTAVCISLEWPAELRVVPSPAGSWHRLPRWKHGLCIRCVVSR